MALAQQAHADSVVFREYRLAPSLNPEILSQRETELNARVSFRADLSMKSPTIFILHGNHPTCRSRLNRQQSSCELTNTGQCPEGFEPVLSHRGFDYLMNALSERGFIVVSINANRGINCGSGPPKDTALIWARGQLLLAHLNLLKNGFLSKEDELWQRQIDWSELGFIGHSRGGEAARAALHLLTQTSSVWSKRLSGAQIKAILEIAATDGHTEQSLDPIGVAWNQILPVCDGDVNDSSGRLPFERLLQTKLENGIFPKSLYWVWGANHNFFNAEWKVSDSRSCDQQEPIFDPNAESSERQQNLARLVATDFFIAHVGSNRDPRRARHFNPLYRLPKQASQLAEISRDFNFSASDLFSMDLDRFDQPVGVNSYGTANLASKIKISHLKATSTRAPLAAISWKNAGRDVFFQSNWSNSATGVSVENQASFDFRVARKSFIPDTPSELRFSVALVHADDTLSKAVSISNFSSLRNPTSSLSPFVGVRIPLTAFASNRLDRIKGVRFVFSDSSDGDIYLSSLRFSSRLNIDGGVHGEILLPEVEIPLRLTSVQLSNRKTQTQRVAPGFSKEPELNLAELHSYRILAPLDSSFSAARRLQLVFSAKTSFPVRDDLPKLQIGSRQYKGGHFADSGQLDQLIFEIDLEHHENVSDLLNRPMKLLLSPRRADVFTVRHE